jgi:hypothetical protein
MQAAAVLGFGGYCDKTRAGSGRSSSAFNALNRAYNRLVDGGRHRLHDEKSPPTIWFADRNSAAAIPCRMKIHAMN